MSNKLQIKKWKTEIAHMANCAFPRHPFTFGRANPRPQIGKLLTP
jgi:hypothetical protein